MKILIQLFLEFCKIGLFTIGGGLSSLPLIENTFITNLEWISQSDFMNLLIISEMTPGPIGINAATFIGMNIQGFAGAIVSTVGFIIPSVIISIALSKVYYKNKDNIYLKNTLTLLKISITGVILSVAIRLFITAVISEPLAVKSTINFIRNISILVIITLSFKLRKDKSPIKTIVLGALLGLLIY